MAQQVAGVSAGADPQAIRDTIDAVFADPRYDTSLRQSIGERILEWIARTVGSALEAIRGSVDLRWLVIGLAILLVGIVVARALYLAGASARRQQASFRRKPTAGLDPWRAADIEAAAGRYDTAAHLLYAAVLEGIRGRFRIMLHPARTAGEYHRELSGRSSPAAAGFRDFLRAYEPIVWRGRGCSEPEFAQLRALAEALLKQPPARVAA